MLWGSARSTTVGYICIDGTVVEDDSLSSLVAAAFAGVHARLNATLDTSELKMMEMKTAAEAGLNCDMMLECGNDAGEALIIGAVDTLFDHTRPIGRTVAALIAGTIEFEGSDSIDDPETVFQ